MRCIIDRRDYLNCTAVPRSRSALILTALCGVRRSPVAAYRSLSLARPEFALARLSYLLTVLRYRTLARRSYLLRYRSLARRAPRTPWRLGQASQTCPWPCAAPQQPLNGNLLGLLHFGDVSFGDLAPALRRQHLLLGTFEPRARAAQARAADFALRRAPTRASLECSLAIARGYTRGTRL